MISKVWKIGASLAVVIPKNLANYLGLTEGDYVSVADDAIRKVDAAERASEKNDK